MKLIDFIIMSKWLIFESPRFQIKLALKHFKLKQMEFLKRLTSWNS